MKEKSPFWLWLDNFNDKLIAIFLPTFIFLSILSIALYFFTLLIYIPKQQEQKMQSQHLQQQQSTTYEITE